MANIRDDLFVWVPLRDDDSGELDWLALDQFGDDLCKLADGWVWLKMKVGGE